MEKADAKLKAKIFDLRIMVKNIIFIHKRSKNNIKRYPTTIKRS